MRILTVLGILFYASILILIGIILMLFSLNILQLPDINSLIAYLQNNFTVRSSVFFSGLLLIVISFSFAQLLLGKFQREKTIAFTTSSGQVTIALSAVEDLIRRLAAVLPEIKELRPDVVANKKGIIVDLRVVLRSEANIPELTSRLQDIARSKIQEVLGIEEQIIIKIHVAKIISMEERERKNKEPLKEERPAIPFSGYGRL